jgi:hypothetical protein
MDEIMRGMQAALPEPSWEEIDHWLNTHNIASIIPDWYESRRRIHLRSVLTKKRAGVTSRSLFFLLG